MPSSMEVQIGVKLEIDDSFASDGQLLSSPPSTISFSPDSSVRCGSFSPASERSTPRSSASVTDLESASFLLDHLCYEATPPTSAIPSYFSSDVRVDGLPVTPSPLSNIFDVALAINTYGDQPNSCAELDYYASSSASFHTTTPFQNLSDSGTYEDMALVWSSLAESPISFSEEETFTSVPVTCATSAGHMSGQNQRSTRRQPFAEARGRTSALRDAQTSSRLRSNLMRQAGIPVKTETAGAFRCDFEGCRVRPFKRMEHLKRHTVT